MSAARYFLAFCFCWAVGDGFFGPRWYFLVAGLFAAVLSVQPLNTYLDHRARTESRRKQP